MLKTEVWKQGDSCFWLIWAVTLFLSLQFHILEGRTRVTRRYFLVSPHFRGMQDQFQPLVTLLLSSQTYFSVKVLQVQFNATGQKQGDRLFIKSSRLSSIAQPGTRVTDCISLMQAQFIDPAQTWGDKSFFSSSRLSSMAQPGTRVTACIQLLQAQVNDTAQNQGDSKCITAVFMHVLLKRFLKSAST